MVIPQPVENTQNRLWNPGQVQKGCWARKLHNIIVERLKHERQM
jgi:hypothetical protein